MESTFFKSLKNSIGLKEVLDTIKGMNLAMFITQKDGKIIYSNKAFESLSEYSKESLIGKSPKIFKSGYHDENFYKMLWDTILKGNTWRGEILNKTQKGNFIWNTTIIIPIKNSRKEIVYFTTIRENINIPKGLSSFIKIKDDSFNSGPVILFNCDTNDYTTNYISPNVKSILGYSAESFIKKTFNIFSIIHNDDMERVKNIIEYNKSLNGLNYFEVKFKTLTSDQKIKYLSGKINLIRNEENNIVNYHGYFIDITEEKILEKKLCLSENKFEIAMNSVGYGIWDWNIKTNEVFYSENWKTMLGYDKNEELKTADIWMNSIHPLDKDTVIKNTERLLNNSISEYEEEYRLKTKSGKYKWILSKGTVLEWENGKAIRAIGTHIDLTERKQKEEYKYKTKSLESLGRLAGNIAHNFNNILMNIQGNIELLDTENIESLQDIELSIDRAKRLAKKMLIFAKGGDPIRVKINNLDKIIEKRIKSLIYKYDNYELIQDIEEDLWDVEMDKDLFIEVIDNIVLNSISAMPNGGKLQLKIKNKSALEDITNIKKKYILISFKDSGFGIPESIINKVFEPFFTTSPHEKEGVGLTTVNAIITKHNGHIYINSKENEGTEVKIYIPAFTKENNEKLLNKKDNKIFKVLVMDDEDIILKVTKKFLEKSNYIVETALNGEDTIRKYNEALKNNQPFDVIIMDLIIINGMNGEDTIKELIKVNKNIKVIASSGYSNSKIMSNYKDYGFKAVLSKPYKLSELKKIIKEI